MIQKLVTPSMMACFVAGCIIGLFLSIDRTYSPQIVTIVVPTEYVLDEYTIFLTLDEDSPALLFQLFQLPGEMEMTRIFINSSYWEPQVTPPFPGRVTQIQYDHPNGMLYLKSSDLPPTTAVVVQLESGDWSYQDFTFYDGTPPWTPTPLPRSEVSQSV
ncbi:MAG: hypothetical protein M3Q81_02485 [bacterium]|nr:hypothetical protein [bacterium]